MIKMDKKEQILQGNIIQRNSNDDWIKSRCKEHEEKMISILEDACKKYVNCDLSL